MGNAHARRSVRVCVEPASNGDLTLPNGQRVCGLPDGAPHPRRHIPVYATVVLPAEEQGRSASRFQATQ